MTTQFLILFFFINNHCSPYANVNVNCTYLEISKLPELNPTKLTVLSLNIQSLPAKYVEFSELINEFSSPDSFPDVVCLQEMWKIVDNLIFSLPM